MTTLKKLFEALNENVELSTNKEVVDACKLIILTESMDAGHRDTLRAAFLHGPLDDGDVPSKSSRTWLIANGFMEHIVVRGEEGFNACTYKGARAYRVLEVLSNGH